MYVKSLTLKGFKSFASATHLRLEPGITCIVGPNGSGKTNVVDALAWVMGEQGAKSLRGGKMEDVIFAGTSGRAPLGRAEVALTIDNTDGALPIDYTEVTIARTMFRNGGSEYAINGTPCRLLDVQELLSDSGIGREMHVIVGQGQLDTVLRATPEERRGFIEEAAGVLKHRKRKERAPAQARDDGGQPHPRAGPHRARSAASSARSVARPRRRARPPSSRPTPATPGCASLADDLVQLTSTLEQEVADESALIERRSEVEESIGDLAHRLSTLEEAAEAARPALTRAQDEYVSLGRLVERMASTRSLAAERVRLLSEDDEPEAPGQSRDPEQLRVQAAEVREQEAFLLEEIAEAKAALEEAVMNRTDAERGHAEETTRLQREARAAADRREGLAKLGGQVGAKASRIEAREAEVGRLRSTIEAAQARAAEAEHEFSRLESSVAQDEEGEEGLDTAYEEAAARLEAAEAELARWKEAEATAERARTTAAARVEALGLSLSRKDGAAALLAAADEGHEILGSVASLVTVEPGLENAVAAALGSAAEALAVGSLDAAAAALDALRDGDNGRASLLVAESATHVDPASWPALPGEARWARDVVECPESVRPAVEQVLERVALVPDGSAARAGSSAPTPASPPSTRGGDVYAPGTVRGGSTTAPSLLELQAALDDAQDAMARATREGEEARFRVAGAEATRAELADAVEAALERLNESDARMAAIAEKLGSLGQTLRAARSEVERTEKAIADAMSALEADQTEHAALLERLEAASGEGDFADEPSTEERDRLEAVAREARAAETELRLGAAHPRGARACPQGPRRRARAQCPPRGGDPSAPRREASAPPARGRGRRRRAHRGDVGARAARRVGRAGGARPCGR